MPIPAMLSFSFGDFAPPNPRTWLGKTIKAAEARAVEFLKREVPAWSKNNSCFSCHNNGDAARALYKASQKGYRISSDVLADTTAWLAEPQLWDKNKGDPGFSDQRLANLQNSPSNGTPPNGTYTAPYYLNTSTVDDDGVEDKVEGSGQADWYFARTTTAVKDKVSGKKPTETLTQI